MRVVSFETLALPPPGWVIGNPQVPYFPEAASGGTDGTATMGTSVYAHHVLSVAVILSDLGLQV